MLRKHAYPSRRHSAARRKRHGNAFPWKSLFTMLRWAVLACPPAALGSPMLMYCAAVIVTTIVLGVAPSQGAR